MIFQKMNRENNMWKFIFETLSMKKKGMYFNNAQFFPDINLTIKNK